MMNNTVLEDETRPSGPEEKDTLLEVHSSPIPGLTIGRYKLREKIGEGGCGEVYVAEQEVPVRRRVALKLIKPGMDTRCVIARFEAERQALARMDHPNIAKVFDGGATEAGRPYFVMELVSGLKITEYCARNQLTIPDRVELVIKVCHAVQHAHQKGIIHRDLKPSNILVSTHDGTPMPKVIDFGIAKPTQGSLTDLTVYTELHQFIGTPAYMSPEQAEMSCQDLDTRTDIYSLGVVLYELLTGTTPFNATQLLSSGIDHLRRAILEQEPARPSARVQSLHAPIDSDLDWIAMKCLEKDRSRRYQTAADLAADLTRHLKQEPVIARPPSATYRFQKLLRRNKVFSAAAALVLLSILAGTAVSVGQMLRARREMERALAAEAKALTEKANAQAALHFIQDDVLSQANPGQGNRDLTVRELLDRIAAQLGRDAKRPPLVEASIRQTIGSVYTELGDYSKAIVQYEAALPRQRQHLGAEHPDTLRSLYGLAIARWWSGDMAQADPLTQQGLEASRRVLGDRDRLTLQFMQARASVMLFFGQHSWSETDRLFQEALALHREVLGPDDLATLRLIFSYSLGCNYNWDHAKAKPLLEDGLERARRTLGETHPQTGVLAMSTAVIYAKFRMMEQAEELAKRVVELRRSILAPDHPHTLIATLVLARIYVQQGKFAEAEPLRSQVLDLARRLPIENSWFLVFHLSRLGWDYLEKGRIAEAEAFCALAEQALRRKPDANPMANPLIVAQLGMLRLAQQKYSEAEPFLREGLRLTDLQWRDTPYRYYLLNLIGASLTGQGRYAEAEPLLLESNRGLQQRRGEMLPYLDPARRIAESVENLARLYDGWSKPTQAVEWRNQMETLAQTQSAVF